ncbi:hypothetical protein AALP_AA7G169800 [Arabis alpina]|uniref:Uncharacterized protein n=1 Tax=Arabis alpina TaxID=50452 RepID=A0A087GIL6_ARAAL|nr:hypothetical protein AALP_AA7G169800 [Arabis alpina]
MLDFAEVDVNLEFIKALGEKKVTNLEDEVKRLEGQQDEIYDAQDVFKELFAEGMEVFVGEIPIVQEDQASEVAGPTAAESSAPDLLTGAEVGVEGVDPRRE